LIDDNLRLGSSITPQFRGMLLEAVYHGALHIETVFIGCGGPFGRTDEEVFCLLPPGMVEFDDALPVCLHCSQGGTNTFVSGLSIILSLQY
jgi:hypothetical protein